MSEPPKRIDRIAKVIRVPDETLDSLINEYLRERDVTCPYTKFTRSLNAMREAENLGITLYRWIEKYDEFLSDIVDMAAEPNARYVWNADARTKAEAFCLASDLI